MTDAINAAMERFFQAALVEAEGPSGSPDLAQAVRQRTQLWRERRTLEPIIACRALRWATDRSIREANGGHDEAEADRTALIAWMAARGFEPMRLRLAMSSLRPPEDRDACDRG